jgi:glycogen debranching enzyme
MKSLGVTLTDGGVDVAVHSTHASRIDFCVFGNAEKRVPLARDGDVHRAFISGIQEGDLYGFRADGPYDPAAGHLFDPSKLLIDPFARGVERKFIWHEDLAKRGVNTASLVPKGIVKPALPPIKRLPYRAPQFIYEISVRALTMRHPDVPEEIKGTVAALAHPSIINHIKSLGVDTIELMPLMAWADERHLARMGLSNAWGYNPYTFCAPDPRLAPGGMAEVRDTIQKLHDANFRVVLDVVYNHSGESDLGGPMLSLRGLDNASYYRHANGVLVNDTGCGNTLACDHPAVIEMVLQSMRHWVEQAGFDGFRYDLAPVMGRGAHGFDGTAPLLRAIQDDPLLGPLIHIAEPWDVGPGGYQLGNFPAGWHEWNDRYRDDVRHFWRGDLGAANSFATRLAGSSDIFKKRNRKPSASVNFISAHDGFTLRDVVTHNAKNNFANGEGNRDGNASEPCWIAGDRHADARALLATLFLSRGTIMLTAGDEFGRTQGGNNNAYAQDKETTWLDWANADQALLEFVQGISRFKREHAACFADAFMRDAGDVEWLAADGTALDWSSSPDVIGMALSHPEKRDRLLIYFNRTQRAVTWSVEAVRSRQADDALVHEVAAAAGIQGEWWEVNGTHHPVSLETKRALLSAMGLETKTRGDALDHLQSLAAIPEDEGEGVCFVPSAIMDGKRLFGLSCHLYSLARDGDGGIGDFETLAQAVEASAEMGGSLIGINPLHHMFPNDRSRVSPYQPSDRRFIDPIYISVPDMKASPASHVDYPRVWAEKDKALRKMFASFKGSGAFDRFVRDGGDALTRHAEFESQAAPKDARYVMWLQWMADRQFAAAAARAEEAGLALGIYRDLALGCAYEGGEVWANPSLYCTSVSIGAPPDPFSADGQVWNLPPFNPVALAHAGFEPFREILRANMRHAKVLRIDHVLGLARQFWVPRGASGADGAYVSMPMKRLMSIVAEESRRAQCAVIGEDLGTVPEGFREAIHARNMLSYKVLWFEQDHERFIPSQDYARQAAVCLSSHDLPPFKAWEQSAAPHDMAKFRTALAGEQISSGSLLADAHEFLARSPSSLMLVQADDLTGETEPLNVPGTDTERQNWSRRLSRPVSAWAKLEATRDVLAALKRAGRA